MSALSAQAVQADRRHGRGTPGPHDYFDRTACELSHLQRTCLTRIDPSQNPRPRIRDDTREASLMAARMLSETCARDLPDGARENF